MKNRLRELRIERGLLQKDVAKAMNISAQSLGYYENWVNKPDPDMLIKLADFYGVSIDYLLGRENEYGERVTETFTDDERRLVEIYRALSPSHRQAVNKMLQIWLEYS